MARKNLSELLRSGALKEGQEFVFTTKDLSEDCKVKLTKFGGLESVNGRVFSTPTSAAKSFNGGKSVNGWRVWRSVETNETILEIWEKSNKNNKS